MNAAGPIAEHLPERVIETGSLDTAPGLFRKVVLLDPDGNRIQLFEAG